MKVRDILPWTALAVAVLGLWLAAGGTAEGKSRYEYRVIALNPGEFADARDWKKIRDQYDQEIEAVAPFKEYVLNTLASEGWELIAVEPGTRPVWATFYFRRLR